MNESPESPGIAPQAWSQGLLSLSPKQEGIARDLQYWLAHQPSPLAKALANGKGGNFADSEMRQLEQEIIKKFSPLPEAEKYLKVLCKMVDAINAGTPEKLPAPRIPHLSARQKNPYIGSIPSALQQARLWRNTIQQSITKNSGESTSKPYPNAAMGLLFCSAILHGGLADEDLLVALARALHSPKDALAAYGKRLSVELSISWQGESSSEHRFWYPDALTGTMISRLDSGTVTAWLPLGSGAPPSDKQIRALVWKAIKDFFKESLPQVNKRPKTLGALLRTAGVDMKTRIPTVLMSYACRSLVSHSPGRDVLNRLNKIAATPTSPLAKRRESADLITDLNRHAENLEDLEPVWLGRLRRAFNQESRAKVQSELALIVPPEGSPEACFLGFAVYLVSDLNASGNRLALSTAKSYLVAAAKALGGRLGDVSPSSLQKETLEDLYTEILEDAVADGAKGLKRRLARVLREFHAFLVKKYQIEPINDRSVLGIGMGLVPVDANLITYDEYGQIHEALPTILRRLHPTLPSLNKLGEAARLLFMLAFKCGLRRMEVLMLKCDDLAEHHPAELLIRPSDARRLKTKSSTRKMPLYALLDTEELDALRSWKTSRLLAYPGKAASEVFLFAIPELGNDVTTQDLIFPVIHEAMREIASDSSLRFHHLRHSFASWTFLRLMLSDLKEVPTLFPNQPKTTACLNQSKEFRQRLYGRSDPTRRHTYAVASLLGHSGPDVSLEHYIHVCDLLFMIWRDQDASVPTRKSLKTKASRPKSTFYRWISNDPSHVPFMLIRKQPGFSKKFRQPRSIKPNQTVVPALSQNALKLEPGVFRKVWDFLFEHSFNGRPLEELAPEVGISLETAQKILERAREISDRRVARGTKGFQHRMVEINFDRRQRDERRRIPCPEAPRTETDKAIEDTLGKRLSVLMAQQPDLCQSVFDYYIENAWSDRTHLPFKDPEKPEPARNFILFLEELGIKKSSLDMLSYDPGERSRNLAAWRKGLGLSKGYLIRKIPTTSQKSIQARKWLAIKPVFDADPKNPSSGEKTSIAFRYLMVMGAIIFAGLG